MFHTLDDYKDKNRDEKAEKDKKKQQIIIQEENQVVQQQRIPKMMNGRKN